MASIKPFTLEETYEVFEAIDAGDMPALAEELGDYLLQAVFYAQIAAEQGSFTIADSLHAINQKLIRRHPHVFGDGEARTSDDVKRRWDEIKRAEKVEKGEAPRGVLDGVPKALPALHEAQELSKKAAKVGFDWPDLGPVLAKVREEVAELDAAIASKDQEQIAAELGDSLFAITNAARHLKVDAEQALRGSSRKFRRRFSYIEQRLAAQGSAPERATLDEMDALWNEAKQSEVSPS